MTPERLKEIETMYEEARNWDIEMLCELIAAYKESRELLIEARGYLTYPSVELYTKRLVDAIDNATGRTHNETNG